MGLLTQFKESYTAAEAPKGNSQENVPDGRYQARLDRMEIKASKDGAPMIAYQLVILAGAHANRRVFKNSVVNANTLPIVKKELLTLGYTGELDALEEPNGCNVLLDRVVDIQVKTTVKGDKTYHNTYLNKLVSADAVAAASDESAPF